MQGPHHAILSRKHRGYTLLRAQPFIRHDHHSIGEEDHDGIRDRRHHGLPQNGRCSRHGSTSPPTLERKCDGLSPSQLRRQASAVGVSLLGLVRHMADVERSWFRRALAHEEAPPHYRSDHAPNGAFDHVDTADVEEAFATWRAGVHVPGPWSPLSAISTR